MEKPRFIPISEASTARVNLEGVVFPPFMRQKQEQIGVNARRIEQLMDIGGINTLTIRSVQGETSSEMPTVVGMTEQGGAFAGKKSAQTIVPVSEGKGESDAHIPTQFRFVDNGQIAINMDEISKRVQNEKKWKEGVRSIPGWSHHVDKAITEQIEKIGIKNLTTKGSDWRDFIINTAFALGFSAENLVSESIKIATVEMIGYAVFGNLFFTVRDRVRNRDFPSHASFVYGPQIDRALVLKAAVGVSRVVKEISPEKS